MPVLFRPVTATKLDQNGNMITWSGALAYTNNMVNAFIDGTTVIAAQPFGPIVDYNGDGAGENIFRDYAEKLFKKAGYTAVSFVDDRDYHNNEGSVHCATNAIRAIPDYDWWEK
jgi:hypothetical protein